MDFSIIYQLRDKKYWWLDVIMYFFISFLIATVFSYLIFSFKLYAVKKELSKQVEALKTVGTLQQKTYEKEVMEYVKKFNAFNNLLKNHRFASHAFSFMQDQTLPYVWFKQFSLDAKNSSIQLFGETENLDNLSRQVASLENNPNVKKLSNLNTTLGAGQKVGFSVNLSLDQKIFTYVPKIESMSAVETTSPENSKTIDNLIPKK